jgi:hypothetical protein
MKKLLPLAVVLLTFALPSAASAQPLKVSRPATPLCQTTTFIQIDGSRLGFYNLDDHIALQAVLWVEVDPNNGNAYCGQVQADAADTLYSGCAHFEGGVQRNNPGAGSGVWGPIYHCTAQTYIFSGPVVVQACAHGSSLQAENDIQDHSDFAYTPPWNC